MGDYFKLKKILIVLSIIIAFSRIFKSFSNAATITNPKEVVNTVFTYQYDNTYQTAVEYTLNEQERIILMLKNALNNTQTKDGCVLTLRDIYTHMVGNLPSTAIYFQTINTTNSGNYFVYHIANTSLLTEANASQNVLQRNLNLNGSFILPNVPYLHQYRDSNYYSQFVDMRGLRTTKYDYSDTIMPIPMIGVYNQGWAELFAMAGLIESSNEYGAVLNSINNNIEQTNQTLTNTYNYLTSQTHTDETSIPIQSVTTSDDYTTQFTDFVDNLEDIFIGDSTDAKTFTMTLPNNRSFSFSINPDMTNTLLTRIGGSALINLIQILWYIGIYGIIIFDFKRMINQVASGDILNITTDSSPIDNVVSASVSSTGALNTSTNHSGGDR